MKSSNKWAGNIRAIARTATVLVLAVIVVGMSITPVLARDGRGYHGRGYHGHGYYGPGDTTDPEGTTTRRPAMWFLHRSYTRRRPLRRAST